MRSFASCVCFLLGLLNSMPATADETLRFGKSVPQSFSFTPLRYRQRSRSLPMASLGWDGSHGAESRSNWPPKRDTTF